MDQQQAEALRLRYRKEARAAVEEAVSRTREECVREASAQLRELEEEARRWRVVAEAAGSPQRTDDEEEEKSVNLIRYVMEMVYRDLKKECDVLPNKQEVLSCVKDSLITSTKKLNERIPTFTLTMKSEKNLNPETHENQEDNKQKYDKLSPYICRPKSLRVRTSFIDESDLYSSAGLNRVSVHIKTAKKSSKVTGLFGKVVIMYDITAQVLPDGQDKSTMSSIPSISVSRRYSDFIDFHHELTKKFPFFLIPTLPPKQSNPTEFDLRVRLLHLKRWLSFILCHSIIQQSPLTNAFIHNKVLDWTKIVHSGDNGLPSDDFLYEADDDGSIKAKSTRFTETDTSLSPPDWNKFTEASRYQCIKEMHTIFRDFKQLTPNIEIAMSSVKSLMEHCHDANKSMSKVSAAFLNMSSAESAPFESSAFSHVGKAISITMPVLESISERINVEIYKPLEFMEVDTMKIFRNNLQDVQNRSVECVKSRSKCEKFLKVHTATVREWISFRHTRHAMLTEDFIDFAEHMAAESRQMTNHWASTLINLESIDNGPSFSNLKDLVAEEKVYLNQYVKDIGEKYQHLTHANISRATVPAGQRSRPSLCNKPDFLSPEKKIEDGSATDQPNVNGVNSVNKEEDVSEDDEDTPMNRAYKERLQKEIRAAENEEKVDNVMDDNFAKDYMTSSNSNRRRVAQQAGGHQRRLKPTSSHLKTTPM